jgi:hypothetical protein
MIADANEGMCVMLRRALLIGAAVAAALAVAAAAPAKVPVVAAVAADKCSGLPGYAGFRTELKRVVAARDAVAFKALFHPAGAMRVSGIGGPVSYPWNFDRPEAAEVWAELEQILELGCVREGQKLLLPAVAGLAGDVEPGDVVALERVAIRTRPRSDARVLRVARPGDVFTPLDYRPEGWIRIKAQGRIGYLPLSRLRSPHGLRLEVVPFEGGWRIKAFGDGV